MRNSIICQNCNRKTATNRFVCSHCGKPLADQPSVKKYREPALVFRRLMFLFLFLAALFGGLAYYTPNELPVRLFLLCLGFGVLCIAQQNLLDGKTHATQNTLYRNEKPTAFWIITVIYYLVGSACVLGALWLLI